MSQEELVNMLNGAVSRELAVSVQYMWHHVMAKGIDSESVKGVFKDISIVEMKHAEDIAERIDYLGGQPTTQPVRIETGGSLKDMLRSDLGAEKEAIDYYQKIVETADREKDVVTRRLFEDILADEEDHEATFSALLE